LRLIGSTFNCWLLPSDKRGAFRFHLVQYCKALPTAYPPLVRCLLGTHSQSCSPHPAAKQTNQGGRSILNQSALQGPRLFACKAVVSRYARAAANSRSMPRIPSVLLRLAWLCCFDSENRGLGWSRRRVSRSALEMEWPGRWMGHDIMIYA
jgi:hypothetical protein